MLSSASSTRLNSVGGVDEVMAPARVEGNCGGIGALTRRRSNGQDDQRASARPRGSTGGDNAAELGKRRFVPCPEHSCIGKEISTC